MLSGDDDAAEQAPLPGRVNDVRESVMLDMAGSPTGSCGRDASGGVGGGPIGEGVEDGGGGGEATAKQAA